LLQSTLINDFDNLPQPIIVVEHSPDTLNHNLVYLNKSFKEVIGWTLEEIPDKEHWWKTAYPDPKYQRVVESLWEIEMESIDLNSDNFVIVTVNVMTKHNGVMRFKVKTELKSNIIQGYYAVSFEEAK
jgi:PAS domain-containing protein